MSCRSATAAPGVKCCASEPHRVGGLLLSSLPPILTLISAADKLGRKQRTTQWAPHRAGEDVFGLRRAFVLAGAKTLVMSLWKVPDEQTRELMEDFYCRILAGQPRAEALREAQLEMKKKYPDPLFWGAFICQGDPGPPRQ